MARGEQLGRQWQMLNLLINSKRGKTVADLARQIECGKRTAYRDLEALQIAGFPIYEEKVNGANHFFIDDTLKHSTPLPVAYSELMALYAARGLFGFMKNTVFYEALATLFRKIEASVPESIVAPLKHIEQHYHMASRPPASYGKHREIIDRINDCLVHRNCVDIVYHTMSRSAETRRTIEPYHVWFFNGGFYLIGHCRLRDEVRIFAVDRIKLLAPTAVCYEIPDSFDVNEFMGSSFGVFRGDPVDVRIWFAPEVAGYIKEKTWHSSQQIHQNDDGSIEFKVRVAGIDEIKFWIMSWGAKAKVVSPLELREAIQLEIEAMVGRYDHQDVFKKIPSRQPKTLF